MFKILIGMLLMFLFIFAGPVGYNMRSAFTFKTCYEYKVLCWHDYWFEKKLEKVFRRGK